MTSAELTTLLDPAKPSDLGAVLDLYVSPTGAVERKKVSFPRRISDACHVALEHLPGVFGLVAPGEVRTLTVEEQETLVDERLTIDVVEKELGKRKEDIKVTMHNHFDAEVVAERQARSDAGQDLPPEPPVHKDGFFISKASTNLNTTHQFTRETTGKASTLTVSALGQAEADGVITHKQYLAMTQQVRVVAPDNVMDEVRKANSPEQFLEALAKYATPGSRTASFNLRLTK